MKKKTFGLRIAGVAALAVAPMAKALEPSDVLVFSHGPLSLRPQFDVVEQYNDNIFYGDTGKVADLLTIISPGVRLLMGEDLPTANHIEVEYNLEQMLFLDNRPLDAMQHKISTDLHYDWSRISVTGTDRMDFLSTVLGGGFSLVSRQKVDRLLWYDLYRVDYKLGERTGVYVEGMHNSTDYEKNVSLFDTRTLTGTGGFEYRLSTDTRLFGEVYYGVTSLSTNVASAFSPPGTTFIGGFIGARGDFTEKLKGRIKAGYESSTFDGGSLAAGVNTDAGSAPVVEAQLSFLATEKTTFNLNYSRRQNVSVQFNRSSYVIDAVGFNVLQIIGSTGRLRADLSGQYSMLDFDPATAYPLGRSDSNWRADIGVSYFFQTWLVTRFQYGFETFSTDFSSVVDYDINRVTLSLAIGY